MIPRVALERLVHEIVGDSVKLEDTVNLGHLYGRSGCRREPPCSPTQRTEPISQIAAGAACARTIEGWTTLAKATSLKCFIFMAVLSRFVSPGSWYAHVISIVKILDC